MSLMIRMNLTILSSRSSCEVWCTIASSLRNSKSSEVRGSS